MRYRGEIFSFDRGKQHISIYWIRPPEGPVQRPLAYGYKVTEGDYQIEGTGMTSIPEAKRLAVLAASSS